VLDPVGEEQRPHAVVVPNGGHREHCGELGGELALETAPGAEAFRPGQVDGEHHGELALLDVPLDKRAPHARGDVPVDDPHLVARLVLADLGELHPLPLEDGPVLAREQRVHEAARAELDELHLSEHFRRHRRRS
jgi:hypothetical protein